ncbi:MAG: polysaccharide deacetylase family protein [Planctomycetota bacterium]|jgi:peptidoglycan/xylan/chitin deacetylase (PgdA/CDA1 family)
MSITIGILGLIFLYVGVPWIYGQLARRMLELRTKERQALVLTFDDGPGSSLTPAILKILAESKARATFFLLGRNISGREDIVRQIAEQGHDICSHGYDHLNSLKVSPFRVLSDIKRGWAAIDTALGTVRKKYPFRPPNGKLNIICLLYLLVRQVPIVYWSLDSGDTWSRNRDSRRVAMLADEAGGAVSLAHDFDRSNENKSRYVIESVRAALAMAAEKGMRVLTVSELLDLDG